LITILFFKEQMIFDARPSKCKPPPQKCIECRYDFDLWPWKPFQQWSLTWVSRVPSFSQILPLSEEIALREIHVKLRTQGRTDGRTDDQKT